MLLYESVLLAQSQSFNNTAVAFNITIVKVIEQSTTLSNQLGKRTSGYKVLMVCLNVLC